MFSTGFTLLSVLLLLPLRFYAQFFIVSSNTDEVLSINPSANVFVFWDFNVHHKDWQIYSGGTDRPGKLCYNFSISNDLTQMVNFPTLIPNCDSHSPALLDLIHHSDASICSTMVFLPFGNSDHVVISVSIDFPINWKREAPFHCIAYDAILVLIGIVFMIIWQMFLGMLFLNSVLLLLLVSFVIGFRFKSMYISLIVSNKSSLTHLHGFQLLVLLP